MMYPWRRNPGMKRQRMCSVSGLCYEFGSAGTPDEFQNIQCELLIILRRLKLAQSTRSESWQSSSARRSLHALGGPRVYEVSPPGPLREMGLIPLANESR